MTGRGCTTSKTFVRPVVVRRRCSRRLSLFLMILITTAQLDPISALVKELHYGREGGLDIECGPDELILIESERLAYSAVGPGGGGAAARGTSGAGRCRAESASCSVPYSQASWYCRGKSSCSGMPVERRPLHKRTCGSEFTNCLRVEYQCVKNAALINICSNTIFESTSGGHLVSPKFPDMYPPRRNCTCAITTSGDVSTGSDDTDDESAVRMRIGVGFFLIRSSDPCRDWLSIQVDDKPVDRRCGFLSNVDQFVGKSAIVNFKSDREEQDMGFWLHFENATPGQKVTLRCGKYAFQKPTASPSMTSTLGTTRSPTMTTASRTEQAADKDTVYTAGTPDEADVADTADSKHRSMTASSQVDPVPTSDLLLPVEEQGVGVPSATLSPLPSKHRYRAVDLVKEDLAEHNPSASKSTTQDDQLLKQLQLQHDNERGHTSYANSVLKPEVEVNGDTFNELQKSQMPSTSTTFSSQTVNGYDRALAERADAKSGPNENEAYESYREATDVDPIKGVQRPNDARTTGRQRPNAFVRYSSLRNRRPNQTGFVSSNSMRKLGNFDAIGNENRWKIRPMTLFDGERRNIGNNNPTPDITTSKSVAAELRMRPTPFRTPLPAAAAAEFPSSQLSEKDALSFVEHAAAWADAGAVDGLAQDAQRPVLATTAAAVETTYSPLSRELKDTLQIDQLTDIVAAAYDAIAPSTTHPTTSITQQPTTTVIDNRATTFKPEIKAAADEKSQLGNELKTILRGFLADGVASGNVNNGSVGLLGNDNQMKELEAGHRSEKSLTPGLFKSTDLNSTYHIRAPQSTPNNTMPLEAGISEAVTGANAGPEPETTTTTLSVVSVHPDAFNAAAIDSDDRGLMYSKVGLDPPMWLPGEPVHWLEEPFEPFQIPEADGNRTSIGIGNSTEVEDGVSLPLVARTGSDDVESLTAVGKRRPEAKELDGMDARINRQSELGAVLSPTELEWLLSEEKVVTGIQSLAEDAANSTSSGHEIKATTVSKEDGILSATELEWMEAAQTSADFRPWNTNQGSASIHLNESETDSLFDHDVTSNHTVAVASPLMSSSDLTSSETLFHHNGSRVDVNNHREDIENLLENGKGTSSSLLLRKKEVFDELPETDTDETSHLTVGGESRSVPDSAATLDAFDHRGRTTESTGVRHTSASQPPTPSQQQQPLPPQQIKTSSTSTQSQWPANSPETDDHQSVETDVSAKTDVDFIATTRRNIPPFALPSPWSAIDATEPDTPGYVGASRESLYNHVDAIPVERDLDKDVVIPLFPTVAQSSATVDSVYQNSNIARPNHVDNRPSSSVQTGEYFVDRLKHLDIDSTPTYDDGKTLPETQRSLLESNVIESPSVTLTMSSSKSDIDDGSRTLANSPLSSNDGVLHNPGIIRYPRGEAYENFRHRIFSSFEQHRPVSGDFRFRPRHPSMSHLNASDEATSKTSSVAVQSVVDAARQTSLATSDTLVANLPEVPAVPGHAAYRSPINDNTGGASKIVGGQNVIWAVIVVGTIGWLVFVAMLGVTIYHKRKRRRDRLFASPRSPTSSIYSDFHLPAIPGMFPSQPSTSSSSPGFTHGSTAARLPDGSAAIGSSTTTLRGDTDSLMSAGTYGSLNDVIIGSGNGGGHTQQHHVGEGKGNVPLTTRAVRVDTPKRSRAPSSESRADRKSKNCNPAGSVTYDILPAPLFDAKNPAAALSAATELVERPTSLKKVNGSAGKTGSYGSSGSTSSGITDFTSSDCGAVPTGWRLHSALSSIVGSHQSTSGQRQARHGTSSHVGGISPPTGVELNESNDSQNANNSARENEAPPGPPNPPPPPLPVHNYSPAVATTTTPGEQKEQRSKTDKMAEREQRATKGNSSERKQSVKQLKSKRNDQK